MSGGGRPPNSAPSLPLHSSSSGSLGSLQTPDTSSLFLSSLGSHARPRTAEFTSLEDLLNFSGIAQQTSSLEVLARDLEQKGAASAGPPEPKRLCTDVTSHSSPLSLSANNAASTVVVSPLPQPRTSAAPLTRNSPTSSVAIPTLFQTSRPSMPVVQSTTQTNLTPTTTRPSLAGTPLLTGSTVRLVTGSTTSSLLPHSSYSINPPVIPSGIPFPTCLPSSLSTLTAITTSPVVPSVLAQSTTLTSSATMPPHTFFPSSTSLQIPPSTSASTFSISNTSTTSTGSAGTRTNPPGAAPTSLPSLPASPAQRALLVQLVQAYKQCSALGDTQGQAKVKAQLNLLLQAQQKIAAISPTNHTNFLQTKNTASSQLTVTSPLAIQPVTMAPTSSTSLSQFSLLNPTSTSVPNPTSTSLLNLTGTSLLQSPQLTFSRLTSSAKGVEPVAMESVSNSQKQGFQPNSTSPSTHALTTLTPISSQARVSAPSGSASALKAAALYNLRLRQLQLFLQSLPEDQRPHSIPELKALLQKSGGPLGALTAAAVTSTTSSAPVPTLLTSSLPRSAASHIVPTVGQCLPQLTQDPPATTSTPVTAPPSTASLLHSLARGSMPLSPTSLFHFTGSHLSSASPSASSQLPTSTIGTAGTIGTTPPTTGTIVSLPLTTRTNVPFTIGTTSTPPLTTGTTITPPLTTVTPPTGTTATLLTTKQTNSQPVSDVNKSLTSIANSEPIKPGVPTPLPPGVNPETLGVLCRMPDSDLQKLKLPPVLMTAIRVWRGQQSTGLHRGRKPVGSQAVPIIIPPSTSSSSHQSTATAATSALTSASRGQSTSRPATRHQVRVEQNKAEKDRLAALNKVLQSSEEARIAYRFNMLRDKMTNQLMAPDSHTPFKSLHDVIARLLPYHMWSEAEPPPGAIDKADAVYESVAQVLMSRSHGLMSNYQHLIYNDARRDSEAVMGVCLERLWQESERERREQESLLSQQAAQVAADLMIAGALGSGGGPLCGFDFDAEFAFGDVMNSDPMLTFEPGIT
ncbi:BRD4-interacting chromatin-remodeling complex-associated protein [Geodia barretti]|uniref:BRD4-interacting chromatin-remodeling complex-associated protein n=1 Tax=Geodia barretti TaxID=519541 RepID=A0AA35W1I9_GEOBA|nr:BRD4-interacting chromatin-remodeling complex-associated protein [Geodia barretti]